MPFTILSKFFWEIWISENMFENWKTALIVKVLKEGDLLDSSKWRGLTPLNLTRKKFSKVILELFTATLDKDIRKQKADFRKGRSSSDHISTLRQILEQTKEWKSKVYANYIDFEKAFDSIYRETLWRILQHYEIPSKIVNIVRMLYCERQAQVIYGNRLTELFIIQTADAYSLHLYFSVCIDWVIKSATKHQRYLMDSLPTAQ